MDGEEAVFDCPKHGLQEGFMAVLDTRNGSYGQPRYRCRICVREAGRRSYYRRRYGITASGKARDGR